MRTADTLSIELIRRPAIKSDIDEASDQTMRIESGDTHICSVVMSPMLQRSRAVIGARLYAARHTVSMFP